MKNRYLSSSVSALIYSLVAAAHAQTPLVTPAQSPQKATEVAAFAPTPRSQPVNPFTGDAAEVDTLNRRSTRLRAERDVAQIESEIATFKQSMAKAGGGSTGTRTTAVADFKELTTPGMRKPTKAAPRPANKKAELPPQAGGVGQQLPAVASVRPFAPRVVAVMHTLAGHSAMVETTPGKVEQFAANTARSGIAIGRIDATSAELNGRRTEIAHEGSQIAQVASNQRSVGVQPTVLAPGMTPGVSAPQGFVQPSGLPSPGQALPATMLPPPYSAPR